jgi:tetratricopeptide (TPR) repeat protein
LLYYSKGEKNAREFDDLDNLALLLNNISSVYRLNNSIDSSIYYLRKSLAIRLLGKDSLEIALSYTNLGVSFEKQDELDSALYFLNKGYSIRKRNNAPPSDIIHSLNNIGYCNFRIKNYVNAEKFISEALKLSLENNFVFDIKSSHSKLLNFIKLQSNLKKLHFTLKNMLYFQILLTEKIKLRNSQYTRKIYV